MDFERVLFETNNVVPGCTFLIVIFVGILLLDLLCILQNTNKRDFKNHLRFCHACFYNNDIIHYNAIGGLFAFS